MHNNISLGELLLFNVRDIELIFGGERINEILRTLREHEKIKELREAEKYLKQLDKERTKTMICLEKKREELNKEYI